MDQHTTVKQVWPPPHCRLPSKTMMLGLLLGALEGSTIGIACGGEYGGLAGVEIGALYGGLTAWAAGRIRHARLKRGRKDLLAATLWLVGAVAVGMSAAALAFIGDTHEFWSAPLPICGAPFLLLYLAFAIELILGECNDTTPEGQAPRLLDLGAPAGHHVSLFGRRFWSIVLGFALKDKASEVRLEPRLDGCDLRYRVDGVLHDMVPPPASGLTAISGEIRYLAGLGTCLLPWKGLLRHLPFLTPGRPRQGFLSVRLGNVLLEIRVSMQFTREGERVVLSIPDHTLERAEIEAALLKLLKGEQPVPETGIRHVWQGPGNCAVATVAMLGGVSYEDVAVNRRTQGGMRLREMLALLERFTRVRWQLVPLNFLPRRLDRIRFPEWPVIVYIRPAWRFRLSHCIVVKGEFVHDPNGTHAVRLDQYDKGDWRWCLILQPASPGTERSLLGTP